MEMISGKRYTFYEKPVDSFHFIFEAEFKVFVSISNDGVLGKMNNGMLTMPTDWIVKAIC